MSRCGLFTVLLLTARAAFPAALDEPVKPLPQASNQNPARAELGRQLFNDPVLSANGKVSCASCHDVARGGGDGRQHSLGFMGQSTAVNAPTVLNASLNFTQFWNGRAATLEAQVGDVVQNTIEMGSRWSDVVRKVSQNGKYRAAFAAEYGEVSRDSIQNAIATYERTLITANSRFDRYLRGERDAITEAEKTGYARFKQYGCVACHQGVNIGGNMFQKFGVMGDYFARRGNLSSADLGRFLVTGEESDRHVFKVPSLRNVALTAPYFHDGSAKTLEDAVEVMFRYQLGRTASKEDKAAIVLFLNTLTGPVAQAGPAIQGAR